jgi:dUTP pyrophosphatase
MKVLKKDRRAKLPTKHNYKDAGYDLYALEDVTLTYNNTVPVKTGIAIGFDENMYGLLKDRSSMAKKGIIISGGVIDNEYTGEIIILMTLMGCVEPYHIKAGDKIAQMLLHTLITCPIEEVDSLDSTTRGEKGFGSSGR